jgi:hypothetical protein
LPTLAPPPLAAPWGKAYFAEVGGLMDSVRSRMIAAVKARLPGHATGDALDAIGRDRQLIRADAESDAAYSARLLAAWDTWAQAGSHVGLLKAIALLGLPVGATGATIVQQNGIYSQLVGGGLVRGALQTCVNFKDLTGAVTARPGWMFEGRDTFWSEFGLLFPADVPGLTVGSTLAGRLNDVVRKWRPARIYVGAWVLVSGRTLGWPLGSRTLATEPALGGNVVRYLPPPGGNQIGYTP